jgi:toxin ParE1/3/4
MACTPGSLNGAARARADSVIQRLDAAIARLSKRPRLGRRRYDFKGEPLGFTVAPWLVLYEPLSNETGILVLRILDTRRDLAALLGKKS